jgi:hypothetical protein
VLFIEFAISVLGYRATIADRVLAKIYGSRSACLYRPCYSPSRSCSSFGLPLRDWRAFFLCMKETLPGTRARLAASITSVATSAVLVGCAALSLGPQPGSFASVRPVLERNCTHCHGLERLAGMPPFPNTGELARLIGPKNWIVPGHPERSRFLLVVKLADEAAGAMPPTGHAISRPEIEALRDWIAVGAPVPQGEPIALAPRGPGPR